MAAFWTELLSRIAKRQGASGDTFPVEVTNSFPAGTNSIGKVDVDSSVLPTGAATSAKQDALAGLIGAKDDTAVIDPELDASEIALLKGILAQMQGDGAGAIPAMLAGSIPEYNWFAGEERPEPTEPTKPAIGVEVDADTGDIVGLLWNGENWEEA